MDSSRRKFIGILSASVAAFLSLRGTASAQRKSSRILTDASTDPLSELGWSSFYRQLDTDFEFSPRGAKRAKRPSKLRLTAMKNTDLRQEETQAGDPQCFVSRPFKKHWERPRPLDHSRVVPVLIFVAPIQESKRRPR